MCWYGVEVGDWFRDSFLRQWFCYGEVLKGSEDFGLG
jgi:hypothetical protein